MRDKARADDDSYAASRGLKVARVLRVSERGRSAEPVRFVSAADAPSVECVPAPPLPPPPPPPVAGGEMRQSVTVWIDYALAPR